MNNETKEILILQLGIAINDLKSKGIVCSGNVTPLNWAIRKGQVAKVSYYIQEELNTEGNIIINPNFGQITHLLKYYDPFLRVIKTNYCIDLDYFSIDSDEIDNVIGAITSRISIDCKGEITYVQKRDAKYPGEYTIYKKVISPDGNETIIVYCFSSDLPDDPDQLLWTYKITNSDRQFEFYHLHDGIDTCLISGVNQRAVCTIISPEGVSDNLSMESLHRLYPEVYRAYIFALPEIDITQIDNHIRKAINDIQEVPLPLLNEKYYLMLNKIKKYHGNPMVAE